MNKIVSFGAMTLCVFLFTGCATSLSRQAALNSRSDVFTKVNESMAIMAGQAELSISARVKTHREFDCPINQQHSHGTPAYKLLVNIDGQALPITGELKEEKSVNATNVDQENGNGIRYTFRQRLRLAAGKHRLIVSLPDDGIAVARDILLDEKSANSLGVEPVYNTRSGPPRVGDFHEGIKGLTLYLNGSLL
jgi:hypothetical protein